jgi:hypothetical protein
MPLVLLMRVTSELNPAYTLGRPPLSHKVGSDLLVTAMEKVTGLEQAAELGLTDFVMSRERLTISTQLRLKIMDISLGYSLLVQWRVEPT